MDMERIAQPIQLRKVEVRNRIWMSPMAQYSATSDGCLSEWHSLHYGARAVGGVGMVMVESTAIGPDDRCTLRDPGIWTGAQVDSHRTVTDIIRRAGAVPAIQLQAAGRKSSHRLPWERRGQNSPVAVEEGGWTPLAPSAIPFGNLTVPRALTRAEIAMTVDRFAQAAVNAHEADTTWSRCMPPTAICYTNSSPPSRTSESTSTGDLFRTACGSRWQWRGQSARRCQRTSQCSSASAQTTGQVGGLILLRPSSSPSVCESWTSTCST